MREAAAFLLVDSKDVSHLGVNDFLDPQKSSVYFLNLLSQQLHRDFITAFIRV